MAMTGFLVHGKCLADSASAVLMLGSDYPLVQSNIVWSAYSMTLTTPAAGTAGTGSMYVFGHAFTGVTQYAPALKTFYVNRCDPLISFDGLSPFSAVTAASYWMYAMTLILGVWLLAHNAGAILRYLQGRRW